MSLEILRNDQRIKFTFQTFYVESVVPTLYIEQIEELASSLNLNLWQSHKIYFKSDVNEFDYVNSKKNINSMLFVMVSGSRPCVWFTNRRCEIESPLPDFFSLLVLFSLDRIDRIIGGDTSHFKIIVGPDPYWSTCFYAYELLCGKII